MPPERERAETSEQIARLREVLYHVEAELERIVARTGSVESESGGTGRRQEAAPNQFMRIAEVLLANGNKPRTTLWISNTTGIPRSSLSQILHRTHKHAFVSYPMPGYTRKKLWALTAEAAGIARVHLRREEPGRINDLEGIKARDCCAIILEEYNNEPMNPLTLAREALGRGYRGKAQGSEDEVLFTTAKSFWAVMTRDSRFREIRPLVFVLREKDHPHEPPVSD